MLKGMQHLILLLAAGYLGYLTLLYLQQRQMMFPGAGMNAIHLSTQRFAPPAEVITLPADFGQVLAIWLPSDAPRAPAAIYFHGNAEFAAQNVEALRPLTALGVHVLLVEYPGYAGADGAPSRASLNSAAALAYDWLAANQQVDSERILAIGRSIGSGPAVELSRNRKLATLVLLSPFASLDEFAHQVGAPAWLIRDHFDNYAVLTEYAGSTLLFHGRQDRIIGFSHSERIHAALPTSQLVVLDCGHNDCPYFDAEFYATVRRFLDSRLTPTTAEPNSAGGIATRTFSVAPAPR